MEIKNIQVSFELGEHRYKIDGINGWTIWQNKKLFADWDPRSNTPDGVFVWENKDAYISAITDEDRKSILKMCKLFYDMERATGVYEK